MANRSLFKPINSSNDGTYTFAEVKFEASATNYAAPSQEKVNCTQEASAVIGKEKCDHQVNEIDELHDCLLSSLSIATAGGLLRDIPRNTRHIHSLTTSDSPTLVPCPTPALTPAHSLRHIHVPMKRESLFYQHESLVERILMASSAGDSSDEAEEPEDTLLSDRDCFRFDSSKATLDTDDSLADLSVEIPKRCPTPGPASALKAIGLGITGLHKRSVAEPFDGLGLVSIHMPKRQNSTSHHTTSVEDVDRGAYDSSSTSSASTSNDSISSAILNETLLTFMEDPLHVHALNAIPECRSWYEIHDLSTSSSSPGHMFISPSSSTEVRSATISTSSKYRVPHAYRQDTSNTMSRQDKDVQHGHTHCARVGAPRGPSRTTKPNFLSATISSELKRSTSTPAQKSRTTVIGPTLRARSATWPNRNEAMREQTGRLSPEGHHKASTSSPRGFPMWRV